MQPIWKDCILNLPVDDTRGNVADYRIEADGRVIYAGKAYPLTSGAASVKVRINDICADYLKHGAFIDDNGNDLAVWSKTFYVYCWDGGADDLQATITFYNDWSYEPDYDPLLDGLHFPPLRQFAWGQLIPYCTAAYGPLPDATLTMVDGTTIQVPLVSWDELADFNNDFSADFSIGYREGAFAFLDTRPYPGAVRIEIDGLVYEKAPICGGFVLYYVNTHGGWDALPIGGNTRQSEAVTRYSLERAYDNGATYNRGRTNYLNDLVRKYTLHTGLMTDEESGRMHHLLNSTEVILHDLGTGFYHAVVLTGKTTEHKAFRSNGARMSEYTIEAELAQERIRR